MNQYGTIYVTSNGLEKMQDELRELMHGRLSEATKALDAIIAEGDLDENSNYDFAKQELAIVEERIRTLQDALHRAEVVESVENDEVGLGCTVTITDEEWGDSETYQIVSVHAANPADGLISNESPIGKSLLGAKVGQTVIATTPGGAMRLRVDAIT